MTINETCLFKYVTCELFFTVTDETLSSAWEIYMKSNKFTVLFVTYKSHSITPLYNVVDKYILYVQS